jgi:hypothetical protein
MRALLMASDDLSVNDAISSEVQFIDRLFCIAYYQV